jgi:S-adenosylmethionine hydrolase
MNRPAKKSLITLLTDFERKDHYVGVMKGVILSINPQVNIVDMCHEIDQGDIEAASFVLSAAYRYFPKGTIHLVVVDPSVGSERRALAVKTKDYYFIAPDNGVLSPIFRGETDVRVFHFTNKKYMLPEPSFTFHGRDVFAPVAAYLSGGIAIEKLGKSVDDFVLSRTAEPRLEGNKIIGQVIYTDRFGNLVTNIDKSYLRNVEEIRFDHIRLKGIVDYYSQVKEGVAAALIGSHGNLEICVRNGNAAASLNVQKGDPVEVLSNRPIANKN